MGGKGYQRESWKFRDEGRVTEMVTIWVNPIDYFSPFKFFKIYAVIESQIYTVV